VRAVASASRWLLFLGAGASKGPPTHLPDFAELSAGVLGAIGWRRREDSWHHQWYPSFPAPDIPAEVLFGTLRRSGVSFTDAVAAELGGVSPNAVHDVAARVLASGGSVWTTNADRGVEAACRDAPLRFGRVLPQRQRRPVSAPLLQPLTSAGASSLVKFHGSVEDPRTLAFTDTELLAPLPADAVRHLAASAEGATVVMFGYAGVDADLFEVLERTFAAAAEVVWFEPSAAGHERIQQAFPRSPITFLPLPPAGGNDREAVRATAERFLAFAAHAGVAPDPALARELVSGPRDEYKPSISIREPPAIAHARLVERFGAWGDGDRALKTARVRDALHVRIRTLGPHLVWTANVSLYRGGAVSKLVSWFAAHRDALARVRPLRLRSYLITRASALRLQERRWKRVEEFAAWAVEHRGAPTDRYYMAHAYRYAMRVGEAREQADRAAEGLSAAGDPERHAGAVLEQGCAAIYQGRFADARRYAFELRERTGRYAIPRWRGWGAWLDGIALCYEENPDAALYALDDADKRFRAEERAGPIADVQTARLLAERVKLALGRPANPSCEFADAEDLGGRYRDDRALLLADVHLGRNDIDAAERLLRDIATCPSCPVAIVWTEFGLAEVGRRRGEADAAERFARIAELADGVDAHWLCAQAAIALALCGDHRARAIWRSLPAEFRGDRDAPPAGLGNPRVLWMMTT
jgi:hypothetical protein